MVSVRYAVVGEGLGLQVRWKVGCFYAGWGRLEWESSWYAIGAPGMLPNMLRLMMDRGAGAPGGAHGEGVSPRGWDGSDRRELQR